MDCRKQCICLVYFCKYFRHALEENFQKGIEVSFAQTVVAHPDERKAGGVPPQERLA